MTKYEKYASTPERFAAFIAALEKEGDLEGYLSHQYCKGDCSETSGDMYCTDDHQKECILRWLNSTAQG